ncbi:MAG: tetratricopeptide repeat protein [Pirellulales bacterium]
METTLSQTEATPQTSSPGRGRGLRSPWTGWVLAGVILCIALAAVPAIRRASLSFKIQAARDALRRAEPEAAVERLVPLVKAYPDLAEPTYLLAVAYRRLGQLRKVAPLLEQAEKLGWSRRDTKRQRLLTRFLDGYVKETESELQSYLTAETTDDEAAEIYEAFVKGYLSELRFQEADICISFWTQWRPHDARPRLWRAEMAGVLNDLEAQIEEYRKILAFDPDHYEASASLAGALLKRNEVEEAYQHFSRCLKLRPEQAAPLVGLAECQQRLGKTAEARETVMAALKRRLSRTDQALAYKTLGKIELELRNVAGAVPALEKTLELDPRDLDAMYALGLALQRIGRKKDAEQHLVRSRQLRKYEGQRGDLAREIVRDPENADLRCKAGTMLLEEGLDGEALVWLISALRLDSGHRASHEAFVTYYERRGNSEMASKHRIAAATTVRSLSNRGTP